jgi:hypothetical protein
MEDNQFEKLNSIKSKDMVVALCNYFPTSDLARFIEFLEDEELLVREEEEEEEEEADLPANFYDDFDNS